VTVATVIGVAERGRIGDALIARLGGAAALVVVLALWFGVLFVAWLIDRAERPRRDRAKHR
jgi:hypothetical protein